MILMTLLVNVAPLQEVVNFNFCIVHVYYCCVVDRHCFFSAGLWYVLFVSHETISSR